MAKTDDLESIRAEYCDATIEEFGLWIWTELEWLRISNRRKQGWSTLLWKELFGKWPPFHYRQLLPTEPRAELEKMITRRNARWKREKDRERLAKARIKRRAAKDAPQEDRNYEKARGLHADPD